MDQTLRSVNSCLRLIGCILSLQRCDGSSKGDSVWKDHREGRSTGTPGLFQSKEHYNIYTGQSNSQIPITFSLLNHHWDSGREFKSYEKKLSFYHFIIMKFI